MIADSTMIRSEILKRVPVLVALCSAVIVGLLVAFTMSASSADGRGFGLATGAEAATPEAYLPLMVRPQPTPSPTPIPAGSGWLWYLNQFRGTVGLPPVSENALWSSGAVLHSRYMVKEDAIVHSENSGSPWYTAEGDQAGQNGNIYASGWLNTPDESAIDFWMAAPFHAIAIIDPELQTTGFGSYREDIGSFRMGATLDVQRGRGSLPPGTTFPITFPEDGGEIWLTRFTGFEWPDPLTSCPGYMAPTGPAITIQLGDGSVTPAVTFSSFIDGATTLPHCVFDETSYANPNGSEQNVGRLILDNRDAVVFLPRNPLQVGHVYTATLTADGHTTTWSFSVVAPIAYGLSSFPPGTHQEAR